MPLEAPPSFVDDRHGVTPASRFDVQVEMQTCVIANATEEPDESPITLPFDPHEHNAPPLDPTPPPHRVSADSREPAEHARPVLRIETYVTAQPLYVLSPVDPGGSAIVFFDDEEFLLLQIV